MAITIAVESPLQDDVRALIAGLNEHLRPLSPVEFQFQMTAEQMADADTTVFIARNDHRGAVGATWFTPAETGQAVGCGALKVHPDGLGEVKRMFTVPEARGDRIGSKLLDAIIEHARDEKLKWLMLETGVGPGFAGAWRLYERKGFTPRGPFLDYPDSGWSAFFELRLTG